MRVTRRFLAVIGSGAFLALLGWILSRPAFLVGASGIGAWVLTQQYVFVHSVRETARDLTVEQSVTPEQPLTEQPVTLSLRVDGKRRPIWMRVVAQPPVSLSASDRSERTITLDFETESGGVDVPLSCPVAGAFQIEPARIEVGDRRGLFVEALEMGPTPTVSVQPRMPRDIHVGVGGESMATPYGTHPAGEGAGLEPAEIREYVPGDSARHIDWNATARFGEPYVREFEAETDRTTALLVDTRQSMSAGPSGETKLDYARQVALGIVDAAEDVGDPLGAYVVGDGGLEERLEPRSTPDRYPTIRRLLLELDAADGSVGGIGKPGGVTARSPEVARQKANRLRSEPSAFAQRLGPYLTSARVYVERFSDDPLFGTAQAQIVPLRGQTVSILLTDDADPVGIRETVELLRQDGNHVLVFLTPTVLFEPGGLTDLEGAFDRYVEFESYRRDLHGLSRVMAYEIGPRDRLDAVLSAGRRRRMEGPTA